MLMTAKDRDAIQQFRGRLPPTDALLNQGFAPLPIDDIQHDVPGYRRSTGTSFLDIRGEGSDI